MLNFLLGRTLQQFLQEGLVIVGIALIAVGVAVGFLARRITRAVRQNNEVSSQDRLFLALKITGMVLVLAGFVCIGVEIVIYLATR